MPSQQLGSLHFILPSTIDSRTHLEAAPLTFFWEDALSQAEELLARLAAVPTKDSYRLPVPREWINSHFLSFGPGSKDIRLDTAAIRNNWKCMGRVKFVEVERAIEG